VTQGLPYVSAVRCETDMNGDSVRFRGKGIAFTATAGATTTHTYKPHATEMVLIDGTQLILKNHVDGDYVDFELVDVDNVLGYGAGVVLDTFGETWWVVEGQINQGLLRFVYCAGIIPGLYIRVKYTSVGGTNVSVRLNLFLHKPLK
jgi:hypothetical protein